VPNVPHSPPRTPTERRVVAIWQAVLGVSDIGVHDDVFTLGGHSIAAIQIANRLSDEFDVDETFEHFLTDVTTAAELARRLDDARRAPSLRSTDQGNDNE
jgi:acyl carrier protein